MISKRRIKPCLKLLLIKKQILEPIIKMFLQYSEEYFPPRTTVKEESHEIIYLLIYFC